MHAAGIFSASMHMHHEVADFSTRGTVGDNPTAPFWRIFLFVIYFFLFGTLVTLPICDFLFFNFLQFRFFLVIQKETDKNRKYHTVTIVICKL